MHTDRALTYDAWALELLAQQKCGYYIIRSIDKVLEDKAGSVRAFGETLKTFSQDAKVIQTPMFSLHVFRHSIIRTDAGETAP